MWQESLFTTSCPITQGVRDLLQLAHSRIDPQDFPVHFLPQIWEVLETRSHYGHATGAIEENISCSQCLDHGLPLSYHLSLAGIGQRCAWAGSCHRVAHQDTNGIQLADKILDLKRQEASTNLGVAYFIVRFPFCQCAALQASPCHCYGHWPVDGCKDAEIVRG